MNWARCEVISRRLKQFEASGYLQLGRGHITVLNLKALARLAGSLRDSSH